MHIDDVYLDALFQKVFQVQEEMKSYCLAGDSPVASIDDLTYAISQMYQRPINRSEVRGRKFEHVDSFLLRWKDRCDIIVNRNLLEPEFRFACAKELCHILLDEEEDWSPDGVTTISTLLRDHELEVFTDGDHAPTKRLVWEHLALFAAAEFLYPNYQLEQDRKGLISGVLSIEEIAKTRDLPILRVKMLHNEGNYQIFCEARERVQKKMKVSCETVSV
ncbi:MAG: ImmA/IrrE family metallo-endopeptidase [Gluconobacter cerinus]|uniref:ImmA/IrrE family metallo-endopeptidase n=1 Tax=Gluconobacter cerinus TaxID=38307 RepID=UPI0039EBB80A